MSILERRRSASWYDCSLEIIQCSRMNCSSYIDLPDRTSELRKKGFEGRRLGPKQMTTDTAVRVTRMVVQDRSKTSRQMILQKKKEIC